MKGTWLCIPDSRTTASSCCNVAFVGRKDSTSESTVVFDNLCHWLTHLNVNAHFPFRCKAQPGRNILAQFFNKTFKQQRWHNSTNSSYIFSAWGGKGRTFYRYSSWMLFIYNKQHNWSESTRKVSAESLSGSYHKLHFTKMNVKGKMKSLSPPFLNTLISHW